MFSICETRNRDMAAAVVLPSGTLRATANTRVLFSFNEARVQHISAYSLEAKKPVCFNPLSSSITPIPYLQSSLRRRFLCAFSYDDKDELEAIRTAEEEEEEEEEYEEEQEGGEDEEVKTSSSISIQQGEEGRLYVGNLPYSMTPAHLAEVFGEAGTVDSVEIVYDRVTDRSRGFAFVTMATAADAEEAIRMFDGAQVGGRTVKVNFPEVPRGGEREVVGPRARASSRNYVDSPHKIYVGNLGWTVTSESLKEAFATQNGVLGAKVIYDRDSGRSRGYGFVSFASAEDAQAAMESMNGVEIAGRPLRLNPAQARSQATSPTPVTPDTGEETGSREYQSESELLTSA